MKPSHVTLTQSELDDYLMEGDVGFCLACGEAAYQVEPDARRYTCEECGERQVYGLEELLLQNLIEIRPDHTSPGQY